MNSFLKGLLSCLLGATATFLIYHAGENAPFSLTFLLSLLGLGLFCFSLIWFMASRWRMTMLQAILICYGLILLTILLGAASSAEFRMWSLIIIVFAIPFGFPLVLGAAWGGLLATPPATQPQRGPSCPANNSNQN